MPRPPRSTLFSYTTLFRSDAGRELLDELLGQVQEAVDLEERDLRLDHPELAQVPPRLGFLGAERGPEAVDFSESRGRRLEIELAGLRQVGLLVIRVLRLEKTRRALPGHRGQE